MARLLHVLHSYPPDTRGGVETYVEGLARVQEAERGHEPWVLAPREGASSERESARVLRPAALDPLAQVPEDDAGLVAAHAERLRTVGPDLVHVHHWHGLGPVVVRAARSLDVPVVVTLHDLFAVCPLFFRLREERELCAPDVDLATCTQCVADASGQVPDVLRAPMERRAARFRRELEHAAVRLALSSSQAAYLRRVPLLDGLEVETPGFPTVDLEPNAPRTDEDRNGPLAIATWGGLVRGKGLHVLLDAARRLPAGSVELHHHGRILDAAYRDELLAGRGDVPLSFHGPFEPNARAAVLAGYDLAVHPSLYLETYGYTTDEALLLGLPVVVPDRGAPRERIGDRGRTFRVGDAADLARVLGVLVERPLELDSMRRAPLPHLVGLSEHAATLDGVYARAGL